MITNPEWFKPKEKPYFHQISLDCIEKLVECMESIDIEEMDCDTCLKMQEILSDEIDGTEFLEFSIENFSEMMGFIAQGNLNIRIHRDTEGKMCLGWGSKGTPTTCIKTTIYNSFSRHYNRIHTEFFHGYWINQP